MVLLEKGFKCVDKVVLSIKEIDELEIYEVISPFIFTFEHKFMFYRDKKTKAEFARGIAMITFADLEGLAFEALDKGDVEDIKKSITTTLLALSRDIFREGRVGYDWKLLGVESINPEICERVKLWIKNHIIYNTTKWAALDGGTK